MKKCLFLFALLAPITLLAQLKPLEAVIRTGPNDPTISYQKYVLPNGLTLLIHEDHTQPVVHVDVTYHVGSAREEIGKSGFAHFFEHMMFQGSEHVGDEQHFKIVSEAGGTLNGTTNRDRTNYFETLPSNQLEVALWLESDRMGFLLDSVTHSKFEVQRSTVKNERGQNYDNRPYGLVGEYTVKNMYPYGHPYSWLTIGYVEDLDRVDENDLKKFFLRWYGPNNAVLTVGGDVNPDQVVEWVMKYFGPIRKGKEVQKAPYQVAVLDGTRYIHYEDQIRQPQLNITYPSVPRFHPDEPALDVLAHFLGYGKNSMLYKKLVKTSIASNVSASNATYELAGEFGITLTGFPTTSLGKLDSLWEETLRDFDKRNFTQQDIDRYLAYYETTLWSGLESVSGRVSALASYYTFTGDPNFLQTEMEMYHAVTPADVKRVFYQYLYNKPSVRLSVVPTGKPELVAHAPNYEINKQGYKAPKNQYKGLKYKHSKVAFDRFQKPKPGVFNPGRPLEFFKGDFNSQAGIIGTTVPGTPLVNVQIIIKGGHLMDTYDTSKNGLAAITAKMMNESTKRNSAETLTNMLEQLGSTVTFSSADEYTIIQINCLKNHMDQTMAIVKEKLFYPLFDSAEFVRVKKQHLELIGSRMNQPTSIADNVFAHLIYGDLIKGLPELGTARTVNNITLEDVKDFYADYYIAQLTYVIASGEMGLDEVKARMAFMNDMPKGMAVLPMLRIPPLNDGPVIYLINKEQAAQSEIRIGCRSIPFDGYGDYFQLKVTNYPLGGAFNSRVNLNLREKHGYTYGARTGFYGTTYWGYFKANAGVKKEATSESVSEFMNEITQYAENGPTEEEIQFTRNALMYGEALKYLTLSQKNSYLKMVKDYSLPQDLFLRQTAVLSTFDAKTGRKMANKFLLMDQMKILVVGDKKTILPGLQSLGRRIVELDKDGNRLTE